MSVSRRLRSKEVAKGMYTVRPSFLMRISPGNLQEGSLGRKDSKSPKTTNRTPKRMSSLDSSCILAPPHDEG